MFTPQRHPLNHSVSSNPQFGELLVVKDQAIVMQELSHPGSTTLWGILSSGAPTDYDMYILAPDSERWTNDFYLTNNFWSYLLSSGSGRMDIENVFHPNETFGQFHLRINSEERIPYGNSIRYLRLTP